MRDGPASVQAGILTDAEFARLQPEEQAEVERTTEGLLRRYGEDFFGRERERLRSELALVYGCVDAGLGWWSALTVMD